MKQILILVFLLIFLPCTILADDVPDQPPEQSPECVVLLHGLARTSNSMAKLEQLFLENGYLTVNVDYPSREHGIPELADIAVRQGLEACLERGARKVHFVTHSLGGILVRYYLTKNKVPGLGRVVQIAPPNQGSMVAERFRDEQWFKWLTGPSGQQLGTGKDSIPLMLGPVDYPLGVIAGNEHHPVDNWMAEMMPGDSDGKVQVDNAQLEGMTDFIVLPFNHITIMQQLASMQQALYFLRHGHFEHKSP